MLKVSLPNLPETAGVYLFKKSSRPIYVGKAINLKRRVSSYFDLDLEPKTSKMVSEADSLDFIRVNSELESLLLEAKLIRKHMPHYNIAAKDDKHPLYIVITKEEFPRVISARKLISNHYSLIANYGPFPSSTTVRSVLRMIRKIFPYSDHKPGKRPCLYSHIGLCNPCPNQIADEKTSASSSSKSKYLRNIRNIKAVLSGKFVSVRRNLEKEMNQLSEDQKYEEASLIRDQIQKLDYITQPQIPSEFFMQNPNLYEDLRTRELKELGTILGMKKIHRIECFDIAHLAGSHPTASMVTFINGEADKNFYRHFKVRTAKRGDDYGAMREIAKRRAKYFDSWGRPDLVIVDGGKGQVKAFEIDIPVVGIAKNPDRLIVGDAKIRLKGEALNLVARIRDEAHRFARRYHHALISKEIAYAKYN